MGACRAKNAGKMSKFEAPSPGGGEIDHGNKMGVLGDLRRGDCVETGDV
jgi:hypothetical protein